MFSSWRRKSEVFFYFFKFIIEAFQGVEVANDVCRDPKNLQYRNF